MNDLSPGFATASDAQICFRAVLDAFATPGTLVSLPFTFTPPPGLSVACASLLLTLADRQTKIALPAGEAARSWLSFHTGAPLAEAAQADFCVATTRPPLISLPQGTDEEPEAGATLILEVATLEGPIFDLSGPGLKAPAQIALPLDKAFAVEWQAQTHNAPRGVDVILCTGNRILALPRSLQIREV